jgi:hypothetical protein
VGSRGIPLCPRIINRRAGVAFRTPGAREIDAGMPCRSAAICIAAVKKLEVDEGLRKVGRTRQRRGCSESDGSAWVEMVTRVSTHLRCRQYNPRYPRAACAAHSHRWTGVWWRRDEHAWWPGMGIDARGAYSENRREPASKSREEILPKPTVDKHCTGA